MRTHIPQYLLTYLVTETEEAEIMKRMLEREGINMTFSAAVRKEGGNNVELQRV